MMLSGKLVQISLFLWNIPFFSSAKTGTAAASWNSQQGLLSSYLEWHQKIDCVSCVDETQQINTALVEKDVYLRRLSKTP